MFFHRQFTKFKDKVTDNLGGKFYSHRAQKTTAKAKSGLQWTVKVSVDLKKIHRIHIQ